MKCSLFTATSVDGIIAKEDGNVDLLHASGESDVGRGEHVDIGEQVDIIFRACFYSINCMTLVQNFMECIENDKAV